MLTLPSNTGSLTLNTQPIRWQEALNLFQLMADNGISPTIESYNAAIGACAVAGEWEPALVLYSTIENDVRVRLCSCSFQMYHLFFVT